MDWSLFWGLLIIPMVIYISILSMLQNNSALGQKIFYVAVAVINTFVIFLVISMAKEEGKFNGGLVAGILGLVASDVLGYMIFNWAVTGDKKAAEEAEEKRAEEDRLAKMSPAERANFLKAKEERRKEFKNAIKYKIYGPIVPTLVCQHCQTKGGVRRRDRVTRVDKTRVNSIAGKAIGLGTNTERKVTQLYCDNCNMQWDV